MQKIIQKTLIILCGIVLAIGAFFWSGSIAGSGEIPQNTQVIISE
jgi:hypothetical protein